LVPLSNPKKLLILPVLAKHTLTVCLQSSDSRFVKIIPATPPTQKWRNAPAGFPESWLAVALQAA